MVLMVPQPYPTTVEATGPRAGDRFMSKIRMMRLFDTSARWFGASLIA